MTLDGLTHRNSFSPYPLLAIEPLLSATDEHIHFHLQDYAHPYDDVAAETRSLIPTGGAFLRSGQPVTHFLLLAV